MPSAAYDNVVIGKLKLKGDPLPVKGGGAASKTKRKKKKKKKETNFCQSLIPGGHSLTSETVEDAMGTSDRLTPAESRYLQQRERIELERLAKMAKKSHRDRIHEFNQYLANLSEHYDIPKVGPG